MTDWEQMYRSEYKIVARIWEQLGSPSYESLKGRDIHMLIADLIAAARQAQDNAKDADEACAGWIIYRGDDEWGHPREPALTADPGFAERLRKHYGNIAPVYLRAAIAAATPDKGEG